MANHYPKWYVQCALQKKQLIATFLEQFKGSPSIRVNLIKIKILHFLYCCISLCLGCSVKEKIVSFFRRTLFPCVYYIKLLQGALRKQQVKASFVEHFEENHEHLVSGCFLFYIFKLSHKKCFMLYLLKTIYRTQDTREATIYFFCRVF